MSSVLTKSTAQQRVATAARGRVYGASAASFTQGVDAAEAASTAVQQRVHSAFESNVMPIVVDAFPSAAGEPSFEADDSAPGAG